MLGAGPSPALALMAAWHGENPCTKGLSRRLGIGARRIPAIGFGAAVLLQARRA